MTWIDIYRGDGIAHDAVLPEPPPWRAFPRPSLAAAFQPPEGLTEAVNAALLLRRPLLVTGAPGSGKSTIVESVAAELRLGDILRWHITSRSTLAEALYRYDPLARIHAQRLGQDDAVGLFLQLGPLGTALASADRPRALLIDEIDKSDLDLTSDMLDVLERGEFEIVELTRLREAGPVSVREWASTEEISVVGGRVHCTRFPFIVMTSNGERDFPAPFLRRCIRYTMPRPTPEMLARAVAAHLGAGGELDPAVESLIEDFLRRLAAGHQVAIDQLLNAVFLITGSDAPAGEAGNRIRQLTLRDLSES